MTVDEPMAEPVARPRTSAQLVIVIAIAAGIGVATAGARPTGRASVDVVMVAVAVAACVWSASTAPWWLLTVMAAGAVAVAPNAGFVAVGVIALAGAVAVGTRRWDHPWVRSSVIGLVVQILARLELHTRFGVTSAIAIGAMFIVLVISLTRRPRRVRRRALWSVLGLMVLALLAVAGFGVAAASARTDLRAGNDAAHRGLQLLTTGDIRGAQTAFRSAADAFHSAVAELDKPWTKAAALVPAVAQNRRGAEELSTAAARAASSIDTILGRLDFDSIKLVDGRIDLDAVRALEQPLIDLQQVVDDLNATASSAQSPWLLAPVQRTLRDLAADLTRQQHRGDDALRAVRLAPQMLGGNGKRVYFIAFCTPAEARGSIGFMGNFAELTIDDGHFEVTKFGRTGPDLNQVGDVQNRRITGLPELQANYGWLAFGIGPNGAAATDIWQNITLDRDFPTTAQAIAQLYPQSDGQRIDGVFALDPAALASLLQITGPISVQGTSTPLSADNAEQYLLFDQYLTDDTPGRIDTLEELAKATIDKLFAGPLPEPTELAKIFGPLARDRHLAGWAADPDEQALFRQFRADAAIPGLQGGDGIGMSFNNASASKIDTFLRASLTYTSIRTSATGQVDATAEIVLTNTSPADGLPDYMIGNAVDLPKGTNRTYFTLYSALPVSAVTVDGAETTFYPGAELGWHLTSEFVNLPPGGTKSIQVTLASDGPVSDAAPVVIEPALSTEATISVHTSSR